MATNGAFRWPPTGKFSWPPTSVKRETRLKVVQEVLGHPSLDTTTIYVRLAREENSLAFFPDRLFSKEYSDFLYGLTD
jgi:hypothetical protein